MRKVYDINNPMAPLWLMYPHISRYSIGWRMGYGENYAYEFCKWYQNLSYDEQKTYQIMFPEPKGWLGWYEQERTDVDIYYNRILFWNPNGAMKYSREKLLMGYQKDFMGKFLFFWGHQPSTDGSITKTCLSQWWLSGFKVDTNTYCCMEQYMMTEKAKLFKDNEILDLIMKSDNPKEIKDLGRRVANFNEVEWEKNRYSIILNGNYAKFIQNDNLMEYLIQTDDDILVEASPYDRIWGIGMSVEDKSINNPTEWKGLNLLGFALMEVRDELIRVCKNRNKLDLEELHAEFD